MTFNKTTITIQFASILFCLIPLALLTGPFIPDLFISTIGLIFLILIVRSKEYHYLNNKFLYFFLTFYIYLIISSLFGENIYYSLSQVIFYFRFGLFALATWYLLDKNKNLIRNFTIIFLATFCLGLLDGIYQYINGNNLFGFEAQPLRMTLVFNDKMLLGGYLARLFPLLFGLLIYLYSEKKWVIVISSILLILTDILVFISGERTAIALLFIISIFIILFIKKLKLLRVITLVISVSIIFLITINNENVKNRMIGTTLHQMNIVHNMENIVYFSKTHENLFFTSWNMFLQNPITGIGPNGFRKSCLNEKYYNDKYYSCSTHPHNTYFQLLSETGIIGAIFVIFLIFKILLIAARQFRSLISRRYSESVSDYQICLLACFLATLFPFLPSLDFFNNWINIIYFLPIGFFMHSLYKNSVNNIQY